MWCKRPDRSGLVVVDVAIIEILGRGKAGLQVNSVNTNTNERERLPTTQQQVFVANDNDEAEQLARFGATLDGASMADGEASGKTVAHRQVPLIQRVQKMVEVPQVQFIDKVVDIPVINEKRPE